MKNRDLSFEQRLHNARMAQKVEEYKARHAYTHGVTYQREEFDVMWNRSANHTWGHGFGRFVGFRDSYENNVCATDRMMVEGMLNAMDEYPVLQGHDLRSVCHSGCHTLESEIIEVAADGKSARSYYLTPGTLTGSVSFDDPKIRGAQWLWERYGSDFVLRDDGKFEWFHEQVCPDLMGSYDVGNWAHDAFVNQREGILPGPMPGDGDGDEFIGGPKFVSEPGMPHKNYSPVQVVQDTVPPPQPYETLDDDNTYSLGRNDPGGKITKPLGLPIVHKGHKYEAPPMPPASPGK